MINKFDKIINNKFSVFLKFIFFLRYLFLIFFVATVLFLSIPGFFDYEKRKPVIKNYLYQNYGLKITNMERIEFKALPVPNLEIRNITTNFFSDDVAIKSKKLTLYPKLFSIYNYDNFSVRKIKLENNNIDTSLKKIKNLSNTIFNLKKKIFLKNLNIIFKNNEDKIFEIKKINYLNYGYKKNIIIGEIFNQKFKIKLDEKLKEVKLNLPNMGVSSKLNIDGYTKDTGFDGLLKGKILKSQFKLNFSYDNKTIEINEFFFRNKKISFKSEGNLKFIPYFKTNLVSRIIDIDTKLLSQLEIKRIINSKDFIKKINFKKKIMFKSKTFNNDLIDELNLDMNLAYGRLNILKEFKISNSTFTCKNNINLFDDFPIFYFNCSINTPDKKKLLKKIKIKHKNKDEPFHLEINGNLNVLNNKVNFENIKLRSGYKASEEDLKYFKSTFESIIFDQTFIQMFKISKIKKFILEIS